MSVEELGLTHSFVNDMLVASIGFRWIYDRDNPRDFESKLFPLFDELREQCGEYIAGPPFVYFDFGAGILSGLLIKACYPVDRAVNTDKVKSGILEGGEVLTILHEGKLDNIRDSYMKVYDFVIGHGLIIQNVRREVYLEMDPKHPSGNRTEIQIFIHNWKETFIENLERALGEERKDDILQGVEDIGLESTKADRVEWLKTVYSKLDQIADADQKYQILSKCADPFSLERIAELRAIYEETEDIDEVLKAMREDKDRWYEEPMREGNIIYFGKNPADKEGFEKAETESEKRRHYCHCPLIREHLDEGISPTHCYCGTGWYRQQLEGIIGRPVRIEILKTVLQGDDSCRFALHLPDGIVKEGED